MKQLRFVIAEIFGLFVDDSSLAGAVLAAILALGLASHAGLPAAWAGPLGFLALVLILAENLLRSSRRDKS